MSEPANPPVQLWGLSGGQVASDSAGTLLRQAREASGLHIAALAVSLKVPVKKLEALEADRIDLLPDAVFARALAASVCRTLKTDPGPVLASLPQTNLAQLQAQTKVSTAAFSSPGHDVRAGTRNPLSKPVLLFALALMVAALIVYLLPTAESLLAPFGIERVGTTAQSPSAAPKVPAPSSDGLSQAPLFVLNELSGSGLPENAVATAGPTNTGFAPVTSAASAVPAQTDSAPTANPGADIVMLKSVGSSWVEVLDGKRVVRLRKTLLEGEAVGVSADLPLYVTLGRADTIQVQVRGKPLDLGPLTKDNVARFEVR